MKNEDFCIGVTVGDPAGIGPEIVSAAMEDLLLPPGCRLERLDVPGRHTAGRPDAASARAAWEAMEESARRLSNGTWSGVVTGPVCKHALHEVGFPFPGQTEFFAARAGVENFAMCLTGGVLTVALVTTHIPLACVAERLTGEEIVRVGNLLRDFLVLRGTKNPRIAVAGLNPHAGEAGDMGSEEITLIGPAVQVLQRGGSFFGPLPPDTVFHRAAEGDFDGVLCMYHDQGLIPLKLHAFHEGVNVTLGLPFFRTSPDHGTAFPIAGQGVARPDSMKSAILLAARLAAARNAGPSGKLAIPIRH
jgi:4-hydroxythreonine-4-phosphate dehydrogenase